MALVGVALLVFGFISLTSTTDPPPTSGQSTPSLSTQITAAMTKQAPAMTTTSSAPVVPAVLPVTVLNASPQLQAGLATGVAAALEAGGWPIAEVLNTDYEISVTTCFFTPGDAAEEAAAQALIAQFPEITGGLSRGSRNSTAPG